MIKVFEPDGTEWEYPDGNDDSVLENGMLLIAENQGEDHVVPRAAWANGAWAHVDYYPPREIPCEEAQAKLRRQIVLMQTYLKSVEQFKNFVEWAGDKFDGDLTDDTTGSSARS